MHNPNPLPWPSSTTDHLVSLVQQLPPNTSNQYLRYILFCYSSLSSCTDHESDSSSDSMSSMSIYSASIGSIEIWCCLPLPFHTFYLFTGLLDPISDCPWSAPGQHSSAKAVDLLLPLQNLVQQALDASSHIPPSVPPISFSRQPVLPASVQYQPFFALSQLALTSAYPWTHHWLPLHPSLLKITAFGLFFFSILLQEEPQVQISILKCNQCKLCSHQTCQICQYFAVIQ